MGVKISFISESISIKVIDLFRFDSVFSSGRLLTPVSRSNFRFESRFFHSCTSVVDVKLVNFCCTMLIMLCILQSKGICVVAICGDSSFATVRAVEMKCN